MRALLIVDVQNDFCPGGALAVPQGDQVVDYINSIREGYPLVVLTQDWHPAGHGSFASSHPGRQPYQLIKLGQADQVLWPDHCVQATPGADFHPRLARREGDAIIRKGTLPQVDSYSAFLDNDHQHDTGLRHFLEEKGVTELDVVGLATDYCVKFSVLDALRAGFKVRVLRAGCRAVNLAPDDEAKAYQEMEQAGAEVG